MVFTPKYPLRPQKTQRANVRRSVYYVDTPPVNHPLRQRWANMMYRCYKTDDVGYAEYGGRGVTVCERWHYFHEYAADLGEQPGKYMSIDRVDNEGGYWCGKCSECKEKGWPKNWRWATKTEQNLNRRPIKNSTGYTGIQLSGKRFRAYFSRKRVRYNVGSFLTLNEAVQAREKALEEWSKGEVL